MIGKSGYKGYVGLEYEENDAVKEVPRLAADLREVNPTADRIELVRRLRSRPRLFIYRAQHISAPA